MSTNSSRHSRTTVTFLALGLSGVLLGAGQQASRPRLGTPEQLAWGDLDGDGLQDLLAFRVGGGARLLLNRGDGTFEDRALPEALARVASVRQARWLDIDGDGFEDLSLLDGKGGLHLLRNLGQGALQPFSTELALEASTTLERVEWLDYDRDGLPDLFMATGVGGHLFHNRGSGAFEPVGLGALASWAESSWLPLEPGENAAGAGPAVAGVGEGPETTVDPTHRDMAPGETRFPVPSRVSSVEAATTSTTAPTGGIAPLVSSGSVCAGSVEDQAGGGCLQASSTPGLGMLYPISSDLFVDPSTGYVGLGTTSPSRTLHVDGKSRLEGDTTIVGSGPIAGTSTLVLTGGGFPGSPQTMLTATGPSGDEFQVTGTAATTIDATTVGSALHVVNDSASTSALILEVENGSGESFVVDTTGAATLTVDSSDPALTIQQSGSDALIVGQNATDEVFRVRRLGGLKSVTDQTGLSSAAIVAENTSTSTGNAIYAVSAGSSTTGYFRQLGTGAILRAHNGTESVFHVDVTGSTHVDVLEIHGGSDLAEGFASSADEAIEPGTVVVLDPEAPGAVRPATERYDRKVAGVVSGAGGVEMGIRLGQRGVLDGEVPVAMAGRVYVKCTTENGPIEPGDRLTTASLEGHAMRATDGARCDGATIGKAMGVLAEGTGLLLVLLNLQ